MVLTLGFQDRDGIPDTATLQWVTTRWPREIENDYRLQQGFGHLSLNAYCRTAMRELTCLVSLLDQLLNTWIQHILDKQIIILNYEILKNFILTFTDKWKIQWKHRRVGEMQVSVVCFCWLSCWLYLKLAMLYWHFFLFSIFFKVHKPEVQYLNGSRRSSRSVRSARY